MNGQTAVVFALDFVIGAVILTGLSYVAAKWVIGRASQ